MFSIITITYNSEQTVERTIKSVLAQTYKDFEYIVVDGASKDSTVDIVKKCEPLFEGRMKWKSEPDNGIYDAMNKGIERSSGTIIGIVNSDDWLELDALEIVNKAFRENQCDLDTLYCGGINYVMGDKVKKWTVDLNKFKAQAKMFVMSGIRHPGVFVPRQVYSSIGVFNSNLKISADQDFVLKCYFAGIKFVDLGSIVSNMSAGGISTKGDKKVWELCIADREEMLRGFGIKKLRFHWLMLSWKLRNDLRRFFVFLKVYK